MNKNYKERVSKLLVAGDDNQTLSFLQSIPKDNTDYLILSKLAGLVWLFQKEEPLKSLKWFLGLENKKDPKNILSDLACYKSLAYYYSGKKIKISGRKDKAVGYFKKGLKSG